MQIRLKGNVKILALAVTLVASCQTTAAQQSAPPNQSRTATPASAPQPAIEEWGDDFDSDKLDEAKWEPYTFEGGGGGKVEVKDKQLKMRGAGGSRSGVRT